MGDRSLWSSLTALSGLELMTPSIFTSSVFSSEKVRSAFPRTLHNGSLTDWGDHVRLKTCTISLSCILVESFQFYV